MKFFSALSILLFSLFFACAPDVCNQSTTHKAKIKFYSYGSNPETVYSLDTISVWGLGETVEIYTKKANKDTINLPLRLTNDSSLFVIVSSSVKDTLTIKHTTAHFYISQACGYGYKQDITGIECTKHIVDSVAISNSSLEQNVKENIKLYY